MLRNAIPFAAVGALALASLALPPGPKNLFAALAAGALLALSALLLYLSRGQIGTSLVCVLAPLAYTASVLMMVLAIGSSTSGVGVVILAPLIWTVLYHRKWESVIVVAGVLVVQVVTSLIPAGQPDAAIVRRLLFWGVLAGLLAVAAHGLRDSLHAQAAAREDALRRTIGLQKATEELTALSDPDAVLSAATRLAAELVSPPGARLRRAQYCRVAGEEVYLVAQYDESEQPMVEPFPLADHPHLFNVLASGQPLSVESRAEDVGPSVARLITLFGVSHTVYVPIVLEGRIDGVLSVSVRCQSVARELFEQCKALGHLVELALANAVARQVLEREAVTDPLTGLLNRRGFERSAANRPGRTPYVVMSIDLDGLKVVNDTAGHDAGDALLVRVGAALRTTMRRGDLLARLGGDEFAALLIAAEEIDGRIAAERMLAAVAAPEIDLRASISIGVAPAEAEADPAEVLSAADTAMYMAKRSGGRTYQVARPLTRAS